MKDDLTHAQKLGIEELYCRPHSFSAGTREVHDQLEALGITNGVWAGNKRPMTPKGYAVVHEMQAAGEWPPSTKGGGQ